MDRARLIKWDDKEVQKRGWNDMDDLANDTGFSVEDLSSWWWVDDENIAWDICSPSSGRLEQVEGNVIIRSRVYPTSVVGVIVKRTDKELLIETESANDFF